MQCMQSPVECCYLGKRGLLKHSQNKGHITKCRDGASGAQNVSKQLEVRSISPSDAGKDKEDTLDNQICRVDIM